MSHLAPAIAALESGDRERARSILVQAFDQIPGEAAEMLARMAFEDGDFPRAEALSRTALENHVQGAAVTLADAVGRQGRRGEAEQIALNAMSRNADSGELRAILGEQRVRQAKWDLGTQDFVDALSLDDRDKVIAHMWRVVRDLTIGHRADKVPSERATTFLDRVEAAAPRGEESLHALFAAGRLALARHEVLGPTPKRGKAPRARSAGHPPGPPPPPSAPAPLQMQISAPGRRQAYDAPLIPGSRSPNLIATLKRDRQLNEELQTGLQELGLPVWPSKHTNPLDDIPEMRPKNLAIDREEFQREHLNVTSGSVASEIIVERALQALLRTVGDTSATAPLFDRVGLGQLELAMWDGALNQMEPIPQVYLGDETRSVDEEVLALGAFLGACVVRPGDATWSFQRDPAASTIETTSTDLEPFETASDWVRAADKDDVHLEEFVDDARIRAGLQTPLSPWFDACEGLTGRALSMKLAELWMNYRGHPLDTAQNDVADAIRPLNLLDEVIFFGMDSRFAPRDGPWRGTARDTGGELAAAYVRKTGEFLLMPSRKHFARTIGLLCPKLTDKVAATVLDLFANFHAPNAEVFRDAERKPKLERQRGASVLRFEADLRGESMTYALIHAPRDATPWRLVEG